MASQNLQMSDWSTTETYPSHHQGLSKGTNENRIVSNDAWVVDANQHHSNDQSNKSKLSEYCTSLSPFLHGLVLGVVVGGLILAVIIALWLTENTTSTTSTTTTTSIPGWSITGNMNYGRSYHTASMLSNGQVLVAGGSGTGSVSLNSAELYNPSTGVWTITGNMIYTRYRHTASVLSNGQVLVAGGYGSGLYLNSAELYSPSTGVWTITGNMSYLRCCYTASILSNGKVLVAGGFGSSPYLNSAELYDPSTGVWTITGNISYARYYHTASMLSNGQVLIAGGYGNGLPLNSAELYNPSTGVWTSTGNMSYTRYHHTASMLSNGQVLVVGGLQSGVVYLNSAELYDPSTGVWTITGNMSYTRSYHTASVLSNGKVLVAGGRSVSVFMNSAELYDPSTGVWMSTANMSYTRSYHTASTLTNGKVLVTGGLISSNETDKWFIKCLFDDQNKTQYWTGDMVSGVINFINNGYPDLKLKNINITLVGPSKRTTTKHEVIFFEEELISTSINNGSDFVLPVGNYTWLFRGRLGHVLPPSTRQTVSSSPYIRYFVRVRLSRSEWYKLDFQTDFRIIVRLNSSWPENVTRIEKQESQRGVQIRVSLPKNVVTAGNKLAFDIDIHNSEQVPIRSLSATLVQIWEIGRLPQTSSIRMLSTDNEQYQSPLKLQGWLNVHLYRGLSNTADRSVKLLRTGDTNEAIKFWERVLLFFEELDKRENISDINRAELKQLKVKYKEHEEQINQIK
ncbi:unnamed protein product [Rotaria sordida]|uniref:Arrestin-like N-terminal domain-containing protein n=1 Tax=Rotaria sordida TaxID=392033 RepID=A0A815L644_9BILA|nr:unnamed protein product [Rotaria sordida]